jgi:hypothetical protein
MTISIALGQCQYSLADAKESVAGYAFADRPVRTATAPKWGYRTYDCIQAGPGPGFEPTDILVPAGLNGRLDVKAIGALQGVMPRVKPLMAEAASRAPDFTGLELSELADRPPSGSVGSLLTQSWALMKDTTGIGTALTHKVIHHKYPALFPLLDNKTAEILRPQAKRCGWNSWQAIYTDIDRNRAEFGILRAWFADLATERQGVPLTLLRLHDILLWLHVRYQRDGARSEGRNLLG